MDVELWANSVVMGVATGGAAWFGRNHYARVIDFVERDLMLIKVKAPAGNQRSEILELTEIFRARIVDVSPVEVMIEISGQEGKIEAFIDLMRPFQITELVRTGRIALVRGVSRNESQKGVRRADGLQEEDE